MTWTRRTLIEFVPALNHNTPKHSLCVTVHENTIRINFHTFADKAAILMLFKPPLIPHNYHEISAHLARLRHITSCSILHRSHYLQQPRFTPLFVSPIWVSEEPKKNLAYPFELLCLMPMHWTALIMSTEKFLHKRLWFQLTGQKSLESSRISMEPLRSSTPFQFTNSVWRKLHSILQAYTGLDRPLGLQEVEAPRISTKSAHESESLSSPCTGRLCPQQIFLVLISVRGWVEPSAMVGPEGLRRWTSQWPHRKSNPRPSDL